MNASEAQLHYPFDRPAPAAVSAPDASSDAAAPHSAPASLDTLPAPGTCLTVAPGVRWIRMALPFALNHINLWLLRDSYRGVEGWTVVDCCVHRPEAQAQWNTLFANAFEGLPLLRVIATHMHPDHVGLAHWLCERWGVPLYMSATDYLLARVSCQGMSAQDTAHLVAFFAQHGMQGPEVTEQLGLRSHYFTNLVPRMPRDFHRLMDGDTLTIGGQPWHCISGFGHSPEHIALYRPANDSGGPVLIAGDMMLPRISTNISVYEYEPECDALRLFLASIDKFKALPAHTLVLPSHGKPFQGLYTRIQQLHDHHRDRLAEVRQACTGRACSATDILPVLFTRALDFHQTTFALGEAIAHLHALWYQGVLERSQDAAGVYRFRCVGA